MLQLAFPLVQLGFSPHASSEAVFLEQMLAPAKLFLMPEI
jgi:hypothetical protein